MKPTILLAFLFLVILAGCGGGTGTTNGKPPIDPSGNWAMKFTDSSNNNLIMSALFSQTGSVVTAVNILAAGNPLPFACNGTFSAALANGQVLNVDQFSGDINTPFGNIHFASTLNPAGTHAAGTYTLTGNCWGVAPTGTFTADEVPSVAGAWTGTVNCTSNCPAGATTGAITATLTQNDVTGVVAGTYAISGLPGIGSGSVSTGHFDVLSGTLWQASMTDGNGNVYAIAGGPSGSTTAGLGLDRSFNGLVIELHDAAAAPPATYSVSMSH